MDALAALRAAFDDPATIELIVNDDGSVYVERSGAKLERLPWSASAADAAGLLKAVAGESGFGPQRPYADLSASDGSRVHVLASPIVRGGLAVTIRKRPSLRPTLKDLVRLDSLTQPCADFLSYAVSQRKNVLIVGGTSSGKTTMLNALCGAIAAEDRVVVVEDTPELTLPLPHVVYMRTRLRDAQGHADVTLRELVANTLRMRPDRVVVGEARGPEALDMLQMMNIGQEGVLATLHASSCREALQRLETLVLMAGLDMPLKAVRGNVALALDLIVFVSRLADGTRRVMQVCEVTGLEGDNTLLNDLFAAESRKTAAGASFSLRPTGNVPRFYDTLRRDGFEPPLDLLRR